MASNYTLYPWLTNAYTHLTQTSERMHPAQLLLGKKGIGKFSLALLAAKYWLCQEKTADHQACGQCQSCQLFESGNHPDLHLLLPEAQLQSELFEHAALYVQRYIDLASSKKTEKRASRVIGVNTIRELNQQLVNRPYLSNYKVAVIYPFDALNVYAANAFLKLLEEPPENTLFFLLTESPGRLLPTLISRCVYTPLTEPTVDQQHHWLKDKVDEAHLQQAIALSMAGPLCAYEESVAGMIADKQTVLKTITHVALSKDDPVSAAAQIAKLDYNACLQMFQYWLVHLVKAKMQVADSEYFNKLASHLVHISFSQLFALYDRVCDFIKADQTAINQQMVHESLFIELARCD